MLEIINQYKNFIFNYIFTRFEYYLYDLYKLSKIYKSLKIPEIRRTIGSNLLEKNYKKK